MSHEKSLPLDSSKPLFAFTSDIDWASEACIKDLTDFVVNSGIRPTLFATHKSATIDALEQSGGAEVGLHPNFLPRSTHGSDVRSVIDHVCTLYPNAKCFRSHALMDGTPITLGFRARGFKYDSNLTTFFGEDLRPIRHSTGMMRLPVFWEDDNHWLHPGATWDLDSYYDRFLASGLKIISVHPIHFALNTPSQEFYEALPKGLNSLPPEDIQRLRYQGKGARTFIIDLINRLRASKFEFHTLHQIYERFDRQMVVEKSADAGRTAVVTAEQHAAYWRQSETERQKTIQHLYGYRNSLDPYATSRDYNQRELEISAIKYALRDEPKGRLIDFGCGNGYTLISIAKDIAGWEFEGVDFSEPLIAGANTLRDAAMPDTRSTVTFHCADAIAHIGALADGSFNSVVTERFLLNLPSAAAQRSFIREVLRVLRPGGVLLMCEGSMEGFRALNSLRTAVGIEETPETGPENLSAIRFEDREMESFVQQVGFEIIRKEGFSYFFTMSRALHPALIAPQKPKFDSKINDLARALQMQLPFTPGIGSNVLWVLRKKDRA